MHRSVKVVKSCGWNVCDLIRNTSEVEPTNFTATPFSSSVRILVEEIMAQTPRSVTFRQPVIFRCVMLARDGASLSSSLSVTRGDDLKKWDYAGTTWLMPRTLHINVKLFSDWAVKGSQAVSWERIGIFGIMIDILVNRVKWDRYTGS